MDAFMNGFEFVLLAIRGRLKEADLAPAERARLEAFLEDYQKIALAYRGRRDSGDGSTLLVHHLVPAEVDAVLQN